MPKSKNVKAIVDRLQSFRPSKQTLLSGLRQSLIVPIVIANVYVVFPLLRDGIPLSPQQRVEPLNRRINDLDKRIKASPTPSTTDLKEIATLEKGRIDSENTIRTSLFQAVGGLLVFVTLGISWRTLQVNEEKQAAERFSKAVEQLGNDNIHVRLGGIYALEQIARYVEKKYYWQVMETLTSYVRERSPNPEKAIEKHSALVQEAIKAARNSEPQRNEAIPPLPIDIQAVMTVLARREHSYGDRLERHPIDLHGADLRRLQLPPKTQLNHANLAGINLQGASLEAANLQEANLREANLQESNLWKANLQESNLWKANLQGAGLQEANLQKTLLLETNLQGAGLQEANLQRACLLEANLQGASLPRVNLQGTCLPSVNLQGANLEAANLQGAVLQEADLQEAVLRAANLQGTLLQKVNLQKALLLEANLSEAILQEVNLQEANLRAANLQGVKCKQTDPEVMAFYGTQEAIGLTWEQLDAAVSYKGAILPDYLPPRSQQPPTETARSPQSKEMLPTALNAIRTLAMSYKNE